MNARILLKKSKSIFHHTLVRKDDIWLLSHPLPFGSRIVIICGLADFPRVNWGLLCCNLVFFCSIAAFTQFCSLCGVHRLGQKWFSSPLHTWITMKRTHFPLFSNTLSYGWAMALRKSTFPRHILCSMDKTLEIYVRQRPSQRWLNTQRILYSFSVVDFLKEICTAHLLVEIIIAKENYIN